MGQCCVLLLNSSNPLERLSSANRDRKTQTTLQASFALTLKNNFTQLNENAVKHNYKFVVQNIIVLQHAMCFGPQNFLEKRGDIIRQNHLLHCLPGVKELRP
jgi:hypothetical protein